MSASKDKGTRFELKIERLLTAAGFKVSERKMPGARSDMRVRPPGRLAFSEYEQEAVRALITEPGRGSPLVSIALSDFIYMLEAAGLEALIECKKRGGPLWHHTVFKEKFS